MYILKNAVTSILRNKGRNILIGIIILVIACATSITLAINNSSNKLINSYKNKYQTEATISINRENMMKDFDKDNKEQSKEDMKDKFSNMQSITVSDIEKYGKSKYVKSYYYTMQIGVNSNLEKASTDSESNDKGKGPEKQEETSGDFTLTGYSSLDAMNDFIEGNYKIKEGKVDTDFSNDSCIINSELATLNNISVGDKITIKDTNDDTKTYELTVTGIYEESSTDSMSMFSNSVNTIITNTNFVNKVLENDSEISVKVNPTFILTSSKVVDKFESELRKKGLDDNLSVQTNLDQVENATKTISNVKTFSMTFLIITLVIGTVVLFIINMINIRERKYEIGVLRTIGMKKSKVALQFIYELLIVAVIALILGAFVGASASVPVSNYLLKNEISSSSKQTQNIENNFGQKDNKQSKFQGVAQVEEFSSIDATVDLKVLLELLGIGLVITFISCSSAIISIQRFSPLTILKERS